jgi:polar amino acid transport system substrate-binding protein
VVVLLLGQTSLVLDWSRLALHIFSLLLLLLMVAFWPRVASAAMSGVLRVCVSDTPLLPFTHPSREADAQRLVRKAVEHQGLTLQFVARPWKRCLQDVQRGIYAGVIGASAALEHRSFLAFPLEREKVDELRSLGVTTLVAYRRVGAQASWDGHRFEHIYGPVLYLSGRSAVRKRLDELGVTAHDFARDSQQLALMLLNERGCLAIDHRPEVEAITRLAEFKGLFEVLPNPFGRAHIYFAVGLDTYRQQRPLFEAIWSEIGQLRAASLTLSFNRE